MHLRARQAALSGVTCALAVVLLALGSVIPAALYACPILAMAALLPVREECGIRFALTAWAALSILGLVLAADKELAAVFLFFGWYGPLQPALDRLHPRVLRICVKLALGNGALLGMYAALLWLFRLDALAAEFSAYRRGFLVLLLLLANALFLLTDRAFRRLAALWHSRWRRRMIPDS